MNYFLINYRTGRRHETFDTADKAIRFGQVHGFTDFAVYNVETFKCAFWSTQDLREALAPVTEGAGS